MTAYTETAANETAEIGIHVQDTGSGYRVRLNGIHQAEPADINWANIIGLLGDVINLREGKRRGRVGSIKIRGVHAAPTEIVGLDLPEDVLKSGAYIDAAMVRAAGRREDG